jgi:hypothetical protein
MRSTEARFIGSVLNGLSEEEIAPVANLGSSTRHLQQVDSPHIHREIFAPLAQRGIRVINIDLKNDEGVDIVGDIYDEAIQERIRKLHPKLLICCNILEHVTDPEKFARISTSLVAPGGRIVVSVPYSYPYHPDPIDTYFRPTPEALARLFDGCVLFDGRVVTDTTYLYDLMHENTRLQLLRVFGTHAVKFFMPFGNMPAWKARYHRYLWLFRPYKTSCVLLIKPA